MKNKNHGMAITRQAPLLDLEVTETTNGRELVAYAAVFDVMSEVVDWDGHYQESISRTAFNRTLSHHPGGQGLQTIVNHGKDLYGASSERFALPHATITDITVDDRGLLTRSQILNTPLGDEIIELVRAGAIKGMSFSAVPVRSEPDPRTEGPFTRQQDNSLIHVERLELALREFGPAVFPAYNEAEVLALRANTLDMAPYSDGYRTLVLSDHERSDTITEAPPTAPVQADPADGPTTETPELDPSSLLKIRLKQAEMMGATHEQRTQRDRQ